MLKFYSWWGKLDQIDEVTFESKNVKDLYFIGEILDVFGGVEDIT